MNRAAKWPPLPQPSPPEEEREDHLARFGFMVPMHDFAIERLTMNRRFWTAPVLWRFLNRLCATAPEDWRSPKRWRDQLGSYGSWSRCTISLSRGLP